MTAQPGKNPFMPGVGTQPPFLAGRDQSIRRFMSVLRGAPELPANMRLTGLRGVGKSVLLGEFERVARKDGWGATQVEIQPGHNTDDQVVEVLSAMARRAKSDLSRMQRVKQAAGEATRRVGSIGMTWEDFTVSYQPFSGEKREDLTRELFSLIEVAVGKGLAGVVILLDEAQILRDETRRDGEHPLSTLIASVSMLQRQELPLGLVMCGLPSLTGNLLKARTYTERMFTGEEIGSLQGDDAREAFVRPLSESDLSADDDLIQEVIKEVEGYPYFIQLWGRELWDVADYAGFDRLSLGVLEQARPEIYRRLDLDFYEPRISTLTPAEQDVLIASANASYPPLEVREMNEKVEKTPQNVNVLLGRLVEQGVLYRVRKGEYKYTAPRFHDYLKRQNSSG